MIHVLNEIISRCPTTLIRGIGYKGIQGIRVDHTAFFGNRLDLLVGQVTHQHTGMARQLNAMQSTVFARPASHPKTFVIERG